MGAQNILISSFAFGGYRSFDKIQRFPYLSKINLFIGQNNSGKSNILRFIHEVYPQVISQKAPKLAPLDRHLPSQPALMYGAAIKKQDMDSYIRGRLPNPQNNRAAKILEEFMLKKAELDGSEEVWIDLDEQSSLIIDTWNKAIRKIDTHSINLLWQTITSQNGGSLESHWIPETIQKIRPASNSIRTVMIPAIRQIGLGGTESDGFSGEGIINRIAKLQNPDVHHQQDREKFDKINHFLQSVTDNQTAKIEIPHARDTILVHMNDKTLPLESLGTGIHEVIILAAAATILESTVICMEEPELHLNPVLQKKFVRYLSKETNNQYFISTHSAALMDAPGIEIYHVQLEGHQSKVFRVTSDRHKSAVCENLGYHPSDLLQSNCIIWVEGPSDRIYLNYWIKKAAPLFIEGIHFSIMFYGGKLLSHLSAEEQSESINDFISLRRLNRRGMILIDSDKSGPRGTINQTKKRLQTEFDKGPGYAWITAGREVENYFDKEELKKAITFTKPSCDLLSNFGRYDNCLKIKIKKGTVEQASKVAVASYLVEHFDVNFKVLDLNKRIRELVKFIQDSNPKIELNDA